MKRSILALIIGTLIFSVIFETKNVYTKNNQIRLALGEVDPPSDPLCQRDEMEQPLKLNIQINKLHNWIDNFIKARKYLQNAPTPQIHMRYKKYFNGNLQMIFNNGKICRYPIRARLMGDGFDHLSGPFSSSLKIEVKFGNIMGTTSFRLLRPETRLTDNEVFASNFLKSLGFISPITRYMDVSFGDSKTKYIFQETIRRELIERSGFVEGLLMEGNEKLVSEELSVSPDTAYKTLARVSPSNWLISNKDRVELSRQVLKTINDAYLTSYQLNDPYLLSLPRNHLLNNSQVQQFNIMMMAISAKHGLAIHNRHFYYDIWSGNFQPIYYDGMSRILEAQEAILKDDLLPRFDLIQLNLVRDRLKKLNQAEFRKKLNEAGLKVGIDRIAEIIADINQKIDRFARISTSVNFEQKRRDYFAEVNLEVGRLGFIENSKLLVCNNNLTSCVFKNTKMSKRQKFQYVTGNLTYKGYPVRPIGMSRSEYINGIQKPKSEELSKETGQTLKGLETFGEGLVVFGNIEIEYVSKNELNLIASDESGRILLKNTKLDNARISITYPKREVKEGDHLIEEGFNSSGSYLFNSCISIVESELFDANLKVRNCPLGDSINIIKSKISRGTIEVINSEVDGVDFDFSEVGNTRIISRNSKNDCLDLSFGEYVFSQVKASTCGDKGISVGERSVAKINKVIIEKSTIGAASKDSSFLELVEGTVDAELCFAAYRKKQEFSGGQILVSENVGINCQIADTFTMKNSEIRRKYGL